MRQQGVTLMVGGGHRSVRVLDDGDICREDPTKITDGTIVAGVTVSWPSMKARALFRLLKRAPLSYEVTKTKGSHRTLESGAGYPRLLFSFHDHTEVGGTMIRKILVEQVGLDEATALAILKG